MSLRKRRNLVLLAVIHLLVLAAFLPGCKEGTQTSPVSSLFSDIGQNQATIDLSQNDNAIHTILGTVVSKNNNEKLENVIVKIFYESQLVATTKTTSDGTFYFSKLPPGIFDLSFTLDAYKDATYVIRILDDGTLSPTSPEVKLEATNQADIVIKATIEGTAVLSGTSDKIANLNVELLDTNSGKLITNALTSSTGQFSFSDQSVGSYTVRVGANSQYTINTAIFEVRGDGVVIPKSAFISMKAKEIDSFAIEGYVKSQAKEALPNFEVTLYKNYDERLKAEVDNNENPTRTTGEGKFFFDGIKDPGTYFLIVSGENSVTSDPYPIRIMADRTVSPSTIEIPVIRDDSVSPTTISGTIYDAFTGGPLEYTNVKIAGLNTATTDKNGKFIVPNMVPGVYSLEISKFGYETLVTSFQIKDNNTTVPTALSYPLLHTMRTGYGSLAGRFVDETSGEGITDLIVRLYPWVETTKKDYVTKTKIVDGVPKTEDVEVTETAWEIGSSFILTTKTSDLGDGSIPNLAGSFKLTHLAPGHYVIYITSETSAPSLTTETRTGSYFPWASINRNYPGFKSEIRNLEVIAGQTTYWTNFEQAYNK